MVIFLLAPDQTIAQMWSNKARGGQSHTPQMMLLCSKVGNGYGAFETPSLSL